MTIGFEKKRSYFFQSDFAFESFRYLLAQMRIFSHARRSPCGASNRTRKSLILLVGPVGLEPTRFGLRVRCSTN
jgi:hypothetical protein